MAENHRIRFMYQNLAELKSAQFTFSSEVNPANFLNVIDKTRSKRWITKGHFLITDSNNKIYINDGEDKVAIVPSGSYSSADELVTAIKNSLNLVSTGWNCTYEPSLSFKITNASSKTIKYSSNDNSIWDTIGHVSFNDKNGTIFTGDEIRIHTNEFITIDFGYSAQIRFISLIGLIDNSFALSPDATVRIRANNIDNFTSPPIDIYASFNEKGLYQFLPEDTSPFRYWKIDIVDRMNPNGAQSITFTNLFLGDYLTFTNKNIANGLTEKIIDLSIRSSSESGAIYTKRKTIYSEFSSVSFTYLDLEQKKALREIFTFCGKTRPFFISFDPLMKISLSSDELTRYVRWKEDLQISQVVRGLSNVSLNFEEVV